MPKALKTLSKQRFTKAKMPKTLKGKSLGNRGLARKQRCPRCWKRQVSWGSRRNVTLGPPARGYKLPRRVSQYEAEAKKVKFKGISGGNVTARWPASQACILHWNYLSSFVSSERRRKQRNRIGMKEKKYVPWLRHRWKTEKYKVKQSKEEGLIGANDTRIIALKYIYQEQQVYFQI